MSSDIDGNWVPAYHEYPVKVDYFNRIRVFATQIIPDMVSDNIVPTKEQIEIVIKTYEKFELAGTKSNQAQDTLDEYNDVYIKNIHKLIQKYIKERTKND